MFKSGIVTVRGEALEAKVSAGLTTMLFTKIAIGDGVYAGDLRALTKLTSEKQRFGISSIEISDESTVRLRTVVNNNGIGVGYYIREMGVYAMDPDLGEILHSIIPGVDNKFDYQPSENEFDKATMTLDIFVKTVSAETTTIMMGTGAAASAEDLQELDQRKVNVVLMKENIPVDKREKRTFYLKVTEQQAIATLNTVKVSPNMGLKFL